MKSSADSRARAVHGVRVLVWGGGGFLGSHLCAHLADVGYDVTAVLRTAPAAGATQPWTTIVAPDEPAKLIRASRPTAVVNAAVAYGRNGESWSDLVRTNAWLPLRIAEACMQSDVRRLVQVDTFSWKPRTGAFMDNVYTHTKRLAGELLRLLPASGLSIYNARLEHMYGPNDRSHKLVPNLLAAFREARAEFPMSDSQQQRDFVWVDDVTRAIGAMLSAEDGPGFHEVEVGTGKAIPLRDFVEMLRQACGAATELRYGARERYLGDMDRSEADTSWLAKHGALPRVTPLDGCRRMAQATGMARSDAV